MMQQHATGGEPESNRLEPGHAEGPGEAATGSVVATRSEAVAGATMMAGRIARWTGGLLVSGITARALGTAGFGQYAVAVWILATAGYLASYGFSSSGVRYIALSLSRNDGLAAAIPPFMLRKMLPLSALAVLCVAGLAALSAAGVPVIGASAVSLAIAATGVPATSVVLIAGAVILGSGRFRAFTALQVAQVGMLLAATLAVARSVSSVPAFVAASAAAVGLSAVLHLAALRHYRLFGSGRSLDATTRADIMSYSRTLFLLVIAEVIVWQRSEILILGLTGTAEAMGLYAAAYGLTAGVMDALPRALGVTYFPALSAVPASPAFRTVLARGLQGVGLVAFALAAALVAGGAPALAFVYGESFSAAAPAMAILAVAGAFGALGGLAASAHYAIGRQQVVLKLTVAGAVANVTADILLIPTIGIMGAALANGVGQVCVAGSLLYALSRRRLVDPIVIRAMARQVIAAVAGGAAGLTLAIAAGDRLPPLILAPLAGASAIGIMMVVLEVIGGETRTLIQSMVRRTS